MRRSTGDASRLKHSASRRSSLRFGRNTLGPVLPVGAPPSRALSAGPPPGELGLAPTGRTGRSRRSHHFIHRPLGRRRERPHPPPRSDPALTDTNFVFHYSCAVKNITITLPEERARWVRVRAAQDGRSVSRWLAELLDGMRRREDDYDLAMDRLLARKPQRLEWIDGRRPTRDELYDRSVLRRDRAPADDTF